MSEGGSRTKICFLHTALLEVYKTTKGVWEELSVLESEPDVEWLEDLSLNVDNCSAEVADYLEARKDDEASTSISMTSAWAAQHQPGMGEEYSDDGSMYHLTADLHELKTVSAALGQSMPTLSSSAYQMNRCQWFNMVQMLDTE